MIHSPSFTPVPRLLDKLADGLDLSEQESSFAMSELMDGRMTPSMAGAFLMLLRAKGETPTELSAAVECCLSRALPIAGIPGEYLDIVGTGGDNKLSFNCSTVSAIVVAGLGYQVCKHGNRAVSSSSGAADALEGLGYPLDLDAEGVRRSVVKSGFGFCLAPLFHPGFKSIVPIRKELGVRTLFNLLGPMINPSRPTHIMMGVAKADMVDKIASVLAKGHYRRALVVHGAGGYDEATAFGAVNARLIEDGKIRDFSFQPADFGFAAPADERELTVTTAQEARQAVEDILHNRASQAMSDMVAINVALAIGLMAPDLDASACVARARLALHDCVGLNVVKQWKNR